MSKEFAFEQRIWHCGTIHGYEWFTRPFRIVVNILSQQFLTSSALALNENRRLTS